jgi:kynureninase
MLDPQIEDKNDPLLPFRKKFLIPQKHGKDQIYFLGNSLGLQPVTTASYVAEVLNQWSQYGVEGFFIGDDPWINYHDKLTQPLSVLAGAKRSEIVVMNHLTINLHLLLASFYRPGKQKFKIICEANAFPSDQYMLETHVKHHGLDPHTTIIEATSANLADKISQHASELALVLWSGVNYYSGEKYDIAAITKIVHDAGAVAGFDLAHAIGNIELQLHDWNVDFACWCSYKYLNSGPGGIAGAYIHERYHNDTGLPRLAGWWGYDKSTRFMMKKGFSPTATAEGWQVSTPPIMLMAAHKAALDIFEEAGINNVLKKGHRLSDYLIYLVNEINRNAGESLIKVLTPSSKGCQVSLLVKHNARQLFGLLMENGIFADWREPDVIRVAPVPLYNTFTEVYRFSEVMKKLIA